MITGSAIKDLEIGHTRCSGNDSPRRAVLALGGDSVFFWKLHFSSIPVTATSSLACRGGDRFWFPFVLRFTIRGASSLLDRGPWSILCCCDSDVTAPKLIAHERNTVLYVQSKVSPRGHACFSPDANCSAINSRSTTKACRNQVTTTTTPTVPFWFQKDSRNRWRRFSSSSTKAFLALYWTTSA